MTLTAQQRAKVESAFEEVCCEIAIQCALFKTIEEGEELMRRLVVFTSKGRVKMHQALPRKRCPIDHHDRDCECQREDLDGEE